ncbi:MAG: CDGSH iron-sulfur domain-containing protein [Bacteroidales bacterium]|jgi:CDGSH-type Zn-finger protein|nr:CDGSH iron-sulfur domain-containing protein [Bacteroidales bacterium]
MEANNKKKIKILKNGPYEATGDIPLNQLDIVPDNKGASVGYKESHHYPMQDKYYLCRCGKSENKPFCDESHLSGFDGTETAGHRTYEEMAELIEGKAIDLMDAEELCAAARFCDTKGSTWNLVEENADPESIEIIKEQCADCPSGRLTPKTKDGKIIEPELAESISLLEDKAMGVHGPLWIKGGIPIEDKNGKIYPVRNRVTLCRCGKSHNKPFCDTHHIKG